MTSFPVFLTVETVNWPQVKYINFQRVLMLTSIG